MKELFPKEIIEHSTEYFIPKNTVKSTIIYGLVLLVMVYGIAVLPFLSIPIFTSGRGLLKPNKDRMSITSINPGRVTYNAIENNTKVEMGDTLVVLQTNVLDDQLNLNHKKIEIITKEIADLKNIVSNKRSAVATLLTPKFKREMIQYNARLTQHYTKLKNLKIALERNTKLLAKGVIAKVEYEDSKLAYDLENNALHQFQKSTRNSWQATITELENQLIEYENNVEQVMNNKKSYVITAPIKGTLINSSSMNNGSFINAGKLLGEITPDTELIAECYISPKDIGLIDKDKDVTFQIDAFNYNQWGLASGKIIRVGEDVEFIENQPFYKIQCKLNEGQLKLKNGYSRPLGKGMTLNARFEITERTLYDLLYDKMDDWLNPGNGNELVTSN